MHDLNPGTPLAEPPPSMGQDAANDAASDIGAGSEGIIVAVGDIPGGGRLRLMRHGPDYEILVGDEQLMGSWEYRSEEALATLVSERLGDRADRVLIGGLGMGFTLRAALAGFPAESRITVAELVPDIVAWARGPLAPLFAGSLDDARVTLDMRDVHDVIVEAGGGSSRGGGFDCILLDVDNGPDGLVNLANERLYCNWGLRACRDALRPGGILAVWSAYDDPGFADRLSAIGYRVEEVVARANDSADDHRHIIWLASRP